MRRWGILLAACLVLSAGCSKNIKEDHEVVFLLHGMARSRASMLTLSRRFKKSGYRVVNFPYSQMSKSLDGITTRLIESIQKNAAGRKFHLIGHSLGNIIVRNGFKKGYPPGLGRIVMLAPPNRPAKLAQKFKGNLLYRWIMGDSGQKLSERKFYDTLPVPTAEFGVIAGDKGLRLMSKEPNDGIVLVEATKLAGMKDFAVLHHGHTFIMNARDTFDYCKTFLETGRFPSD